MMCDGSWEDVQGELEGAAASCDYLPATCWQGLINLFSYYEAVPECEWSSARSSLGSLASALESLEKELLGSIRFADQDYIAETKLYYDSVLGKLRRAGDLFAPGWLLEVVEICQDEFLRSFMPFIGSLEKRKSCFDVFDHWLCGIACAAVGSFAMVARQFLPSTGSTQR